VKKITAIIITAVYLLSAIGVSASSFYCCGMLRSTTLSIGESHSTDSKTALKASGCCKTVKHSFKVKDNHFSSASFTFVSKNFQVLGTFPAIMVENIWFTKTYTAFNSNAPPVGLQKTPIYSLHCTYLL
jgi:hypothetical protein